MSLQTRKIKGRDSRRAHPLRQRGVECECSKSAGRGHVVALEKQLKQADKNDP